MLRQWPSGNMTTLAIDIITNHHHTACSATMQALGFFGFFFFISLSQIKAFHALNWAVNMVWKRECHVETGEKSHLTFLGTVMHQEKGGQWVREQRCAWNPSSLSSLLLSSPSNQGFFFCFVQKGSEAIQSQDDTVSSCCTLAPCLLLLLPPIIWLSLRPLHKHKHTSLDTYAGWDCSLEKSPNSNSKLRLYLCFSACHVH